MFLKELVNIKKELSSHHTPRNKLFEEAVKSRLDKGLNSYKYEITNYYDYLVKRECFSMLRRFSRR